LVDWLVRCLVACSLFGLSVVWFIAYLLVCSVVCLAVRLFCRLPSHCCNVQSITTGHDKIQRGLPG
jgi:hypothetical protein